VRARRGARSARRDAHAYGTHALAACAGQTLSRVVAGLDHNIAFTAERALYAWGRNDQGKEAARGLCLRCALRCSALVRACVTCQGRRGTTLPAFLRAGQLGLGDRFDRTTPTALSLGDGAGDVADACVGQFHTLLLNASGRVYASGGNAHGQLGTGAAPDAQAASPVLVGGALAGVDVTAVACGTAHSLALAADGAVYAWGAASAGQLGLGGCDVLTNDDGPSPCDVCSYLTYTNPGVTTTNFTAKTSCTVLPCTATVTYQLIYGSPPPLAALPPPPPPATLAPPPPGAVQTCPYFDSAISATGTCNVSVPVGATLLIGSCRVPGSSCSGDTSISLLTAPGGDASSSAAAAAAASCVLEPVFVPTRVPGLPPAKLIAAGGGFAGGAAAPGGALGAAHSLAVSLEGDELWSWGDNFFGQLGVPHRYTSIAPFAMGVTAHEFDAASGGALLGDAAAAAALASTPGSLGAANASGIANASDANATITAANASDANASDANATAPPASSLLLPQLSYASLAQWTVAARVRPAVSDAAPARVASRHASPVRVGPLAPDTVITALSAGGSHSLALTSKGEIWAWGDNREGQLGLGYTSRPFEDDLFFQRRATAAPVLVDRPLRLRAWDHASEEDGGGVVTGRSNAVGGGRFVAAHAGVATTIALTEGGTAWIWGSNAAGALGTCGCGACAAFYAAAGCARVRCAA
jgi:alpha-tubulin suppressor-like RCC1 family protein